MHSMLLLVVLQGCSVQQALGFSWWQRGLYT